MCDIMLPSYKLIHSTACNDMYYEGADRSQVRRHALTNNLPRTTLPTNQNKSKPLESEKETKDRFKRTK